MSTGRDRDPRHYTPEFVKELRKERDLYSRSILKSIASNNKVAAAAQQSASPAAALGGSQGLLDAPAVNVVHGSTPILSLSRASRSLHSELNSGNGSPTSGAANESIRSKRSISQRSQNLGVSSQPGSAASLSASPCHSSVKSKSSLYITSTMPSGTANVPASSGKGPNSSGNVPPQVVSGPGGIARRRASIVSFNSIQSKRHDRKHGTLTRAANHHHHEPRTRLNTTATNGSNSSSISKTEAWEDAFEPIVGTVTLQMPFHYTWYGALLFIGYFVNWIENTRPTMLSIYFGISFVVVQTSRIVYEYNKLSLVPMYMSFLPFFVFCLLSREGHILFSVLWFITLMVVNMQCGASKLKMHVLGSSLCLLITYVVCIALMYDQSPLNIFNNTNGAYLPELKPIGGGIVIGAEGTFLVFMALLQGGLFMLQRFIKLYAYFLIDRQRRMQRLQVANQELQDKLKSLKGDVDLDLDSPITKVIQIIKRMQAKENMDAEIIESLDYVIGILSSNKLFQVDLNAFKETLDADVKSWLDNMFQNQPSEPSHDITNQTHLGVHNSGPNHAEGLAPGGSTNVGGSFHQLSVTGPTPTGSVLNAAAKTTSAKSSLPRTNSLSQNGAAAAYPGVFEVVYKPVLANDTLIQKALSMSESWDFNCFELAQVTNGRPLHYLAMHIFARHDFFGAFRLDSAKVDMFLTLVENGYRMNPYHNSIHATDVMQTIHFFISTMHVSDMISVEERLACIIAACVHDVDHPGVNNSFLVDSQSDLAARYNDQAVLENHHCARAFEWLITNEKCNFLSHLPRPIFQHIRANIVRMVLATDMSMHYELWNRFKIKSQGTAGVDFKDVKDRNLVMSIAIKCADVSNPTKSPPLAQKWTELVMEEFYMQGDLEKSLGLPISRFMDRSAPRVGVCQIGFIDYVVQPLYELWDKFLNDSDSMPALENIKNNREFWKNWQDLPAGSQLRISEIATPDYLQTGMITNIKVSSFPPTFQQVNTVCNSAIPSPPLEDDDMRASRTSTGSSISKATRKAKESEGRPNSG